MCRYLKYLKRRTTRYGFFFIITKKPYLVNKRTTGEQVEYLKKIANMVYLERQYLVFIELKRHIFRIL